VRAYECVCDLETSAMRWSRPELGCDVTENKNSCYSDKNTDIYIYISGSQMRGVGFFFQIRNSTPRKLIF